MRKQHDQFLSKVIYDLIQLCRSCGGLLLTPRLTVAKKQDSELEFH